MSKKAVSARGEAVDFDLLAIKQQLAATPVPVSVDDRRRFIDERDGLRSRSNKGQQEQAQQEQQAQVPDALAVAQQAAVESAAAGTRQKRRAAKPTAPAEEGADVEAEPEA
jgi:hypothetical protein